MITENFCTITLQPVPSHEFFSTIGNRRTNTLKPIFKTFFFEKISSCIEHIECLLKQMIERLKQKGCVVTLLDLKNVFGEVNHNLLIESLKVCHVPALIILLNCRIAVATRGYDF